MASSIWPQLPIELIEYIISETWVSPLSAKDRGTLISSSPLVNKTWAAAFANVSLRDVHIPNISYAQQYLRILRNENLVYAEGSQILPDVLCTSLTFTLDTHASALGQHPLFIKPFGEQDRLGTMLSNTLYAIYSLSYLPNLRRVSIEYTNWGYNDLFDNFRLSAFPSQVTELEIRFSDRRGIKSTSQQYHRQPGRVPWSLPSVTHLLTRGASEEFTADMVAACPNLETLEIYSTPRLAILASLPCNVHTVVLRMPCKKSYQRHIEGLVGAMVVGLSTSLTSCRPRIKLQWGDRAVDVDMVEGNRRNMRCSVGSRAYDIMEVAHSCKELIRRDVNKR
jgi:hypothetical protein